ncbi:hypothetical protein GCM10007874_31710 [Labrys miyagiensis]|uniref:ANTAR domain-containing protein n=1 Tax=Labrys miyagiensis TaxID=346912 RepID=A0ABQ6CIW2_9HYPH|nr:hypothetical protein [Labrys miyagiensis]GLS20154.1 hypothetical protein GCM10007874_31710 [Labrys miyagiensis]
MRGPKRETAISDRLLECQEDMEAATTIVIETAMRVGWTEAEVCLALQELADNRLIATQCNAAMDAAIKRAMGRGRSNG